MKEFINLPENIIHQFLQDNEDGMKQILTWFLNTIMEYEAKIRAAHHTMNEILQEKLIGMDIEREVLRQSMVL